jgi:hypothetical protein
MRRFAIISLVILTAACGIRQAGSGERTITFTTPATRDTLLARAAVALTQMGFQIGGIEEGMLFTVPRTLPDSIAPALGGQRQQWFVQIHATNQRFIAGSSGVVRGYLIPMTAAPPSQGNAVRENAEPVSIERPAIFRELERVAAGVREAATRGLLR